MPSSVDLLSAKSTEGSTFRLNNCSTRKATCIKKWPRKITEMLHERVCPERIKQNESGRVNFQCMCLFAAECSSSTSKQFVGCVDSLGDMGSQVSLLQWDDLSNFLCREGIQIFVSLAISLVKAGYIAVWASSLLVSQVKAGYLAVWASSLQAVRHNGFYPVCQIVGVRCIADLLRKVKRHERGKKLVDEIISSLES